MTTGMLMEMVAGKTKLLNGKNYDATAFEPNTIEDISKELHSLGFQRYGNERMYNGMTGKLMDAMVFIGPCYYQRLKHMVIDKYHMRSTGPVQNLVRQSREGGLRFGEMEVTQIIAHGASSFLREKLFINSDKFKTWVCCTCGFTAMYDIKKSNAECKVCSKKGVPSVFKEVYIPYATKLLFQELMAMNIIPRMRV
jgi:DNA-directed RNA polymerase II subunit RPB2